ncbi:MAG TPA: hypothetical protein VMG98_11215 [Verrucomicrobiae bacterium]|nr:hypothetical protein [Verrucomicrobiae bacterium]
MRLPLLSVFLSAILVSACSGTSGFTPASGSQSSFSLAPSSIDLTPDSPTDTFNGQGDTAGVSYTANASPACATSTGSIVVGGNGVAEPDVAGSPLIFTVAAVGGSPPATCAITVSGSDSSSAMVTVNYSDNPVIDVPDATHTSGVVHLMAGSAPTALSFTSLVPQNFTVSGFVGNVTASTTCKSSKSGVTVSLGQNDTFTVIPFGQGTISNTCTIALADQSKNSATVSVALSIGAMAKLTAVPRNVQFGCAGSSAPYNCQTLSAVAVAESGTQTYTIVTRPTLSGTCAKAFYGPLTMTTNGTTFVQSVSGSAVTLTFAGLLTTKSLNCSQIVITDGNSPAQRASIAVNSQIGATPGGLAVATPPPCTGTDARVADPTAPHGMYVWNPYEVQGGEYEADMEQYVIGKDASGKPKDPNICGVSLLVEWAEVEKTKGTFNWTKVISQAMPYFNAGLSVNLLFVDASETGTSNTATPSWVTDPSGDNVGVVQCNDQVPAPDFMDSTYEADWEALISAAVTEFTVPGNAPINAQIGYLRFGIGAGTEAYAAHMTGSSEAALACLALWKGTPANGGANWTYDNWVAHTRRIINYIGTLNTSGKQVMAAMNEIPDYPNTIYDYANTEAEVAANNGIGFGTENLGIGDIADVNGKAPQPCNPQIYNASLYWCEPFVRHVGRVPFEFQPIEAVANQSAGYDIDFTNLLQYALINNTQIFELYPEDWLEADMPTQLFPGYGADAKTWKAAMTNTSAIVGGQQQ